jgi:hypothetical protein
MNKHQIETLAAAFARCLTQAENVIEYYKGHKREYAREHKRSLDCRLPTKKRSEALARANSSHRTVSNYQNTHPLLRTNAGQPTLAIQIALGMLPEELKNNERLYVNRYRRPFFLVRFWRWLFGRRY